MTVSSSQIVKRWFYPFCHCRTIPQLRPKVLPASHIHHLNQYQAARTSSHFASAWSNVHALSPDTAHIPYSSVTFIESPKVYGEWPGTPTVRKDIQPGQLIWASMNITPEALQPPKPGSYQSKAMRWIFKRRPVDKIAYVLQVTDKYVFAAYATTLGSAPDLSAIVTNTKLWYPVSPARRNGGLEPLDEVDGIPAWIYLGMPVVIGYEPISVLKERLSERSLDRIRAAMVYKRFQVV